MDLILGASRAAIVPPTPGAGPWVPAFAGTAGVRGSAAWPNPKPALPASNAARSRLAGPGAARAAAPGTALSRNCRAPRRRKASAPRPGRRRARRSRGLDFVALRGDSAGPPRRLTGIAELDRVCGGGLVPGSTILVGGDPGIGKSTLLLQAAASLAGEGGEAAYITGEEAIEQVRLRAERLGVADTPVRLASAGSVRDIIAALDGGRGPDLVVINSIQTMYLDTLDSAPGTVSQVRGAAQELIGLAKRRGMAIVLVGHVTKEGLIAGPRVLEHMVDTVLYFEGERGHQFRILRAVKNRFGATDEIGVFEMGDRGLAEVPNPSALFLADRALSIPRPMSGGSGSRVALAGAAVFAGIEGTRPVLVEVQALVAPSPLGTPRRAVVGWDANRLAMLTAVLDARCGLSVGPNDIYLNIAGGLAHRRAGRRPRGRGGAGLGADRDPGAARHRRVRRDRAVGPGAAGRACRSQAQGSRQARFCAGLGSGAAIARRQAGRRRRAQDGADPHLSELVALLSPSPARRGFSPDRPKRTPPAGAPRIMATR